MNHQLLPENSCPAIPFGIVDMKIAWEKKIWPSLCTLTSRDYLPHFKVQTRLTTLAPSLKSLTWAIRLMMQRLSDRANYNINVCV